MQIKVDTKGYIIKGLRAAARDIRACVDRKELYFVYFNLKSRELSVNIPVGKDPDEILLIESGVYKMSQQQLADITIDVLTSRVYT